MTFQNMDKSEGSGVCDFQDKECKDGFEQKEETDSKKKDDTEAKKDESKKEDDKKD